MWWFNVDVSVVVMFAAAGACLMWCTADMTAMMRDTLRVVAGVGGSLLAACVAGHAVCIAPDRIGAPIAARRTHGGDTTDRSKP